MTVNDERHRLAKQWEVLGYDPKKFGSATIAPPPPNNDFVRGYHLTSTEHGISSIALQRLKVSRFSEVNDPFELRALSLHERDDRKAVAIFKANEDSTTGLLCFSKNWTNPVLWSHYADKHKGICLGFDLRRSTVGDVHYLRKPVRLCLADAEDRLPFAKADYWEYEEEIRRLITLAKAKREGQLYFWPFDPDIRLVEVILGELSGLSVPDVESLTQVTNQEVYVSQARLQRTGFRVIPHGGRVSSKLRT